MRRHPLLIAVAAVGLISPVASQAQQTRSAAIAEQVAQKEKQAQPPKPSKIEAALLRVEKQNPATSRKKDGWYPKFGGLAPGAGIALGAGYRQSLPWADAQSDVFASYSLRGYRRVQGYVTVPKLGGAPLELRTGVRYRDLPRERFYGLGQSAAQTDRTSFWLRDVDYTVALATQWPRGLRAGVETGYLNHSLSSGTYRRAPSLEQRFSGVNAPGLLAAPDFLHTTLFLELDSTDAPAYPREGGHYRVALGRFNDLGVDGFSFNRFQGAALHHFPFFNQRRVIALRGLIVLSDPDSGSEVPFYLMPTLGGSSDLRGYDLARFRDRNAVLMGAEYRWEVFAALDMALFVDAGKVARNVRQLGFNDLEVTPGIGFRVNGAEKLMIRFDLAHGRDGMVYHFKVGKSW
jgi:outer membrane protein assembly factor BamA